MRSTIFLVLLTLLAAPAVAQEWGNLSAKFVLSGTPPTPRKLDVNKDVEYCGQHGLVDETIKVGQGGALGNVVIYLTPRPGAKTPVHPSYEEELKKEVLIDNAKCRFDSHVTVVRTKQKIVIGNSDPIGHNTKADFFNNPSFNDLIPAKSSITKVFEKAETTPSTISCSIHPWMSAKLLILDHPYAAVSSEKDGTISMKNVPVGTWTFTVWHESVGYVNEFKQGAKAVALRRGRWELDIKKGDNDLGTLTVDVKTLTAKTK
jgi:hypothetical protein